MNGPRIVATAAFLLLLRSQQCDAAACMRRMDRYRGQMMSDARIRMLNSP